MFWNKKNNSKNASEQRVLIHTSPGWYGSKLSDYGSALKAGDYTVISQIFCVFTENHAPSKNYAAQLLSDVLDVISFDEWIRIDAQMRQTTSMEWFINWRDYSIESLFTSEMSETECRAVTVFASFNPNGFIRERAVRMMKDSVGTLAYIVLRQNDWVPQVREAALESAVYRLSHLSSGELVAALPFIDKVNRGERIINKNICMKQVYRALTSDENRNDLVAGFRAANIRTRRICTNAVFNAERPEYELAYERIKQETDPFLRAYVFQKLMENKQDKDVVDQFLKDRYPLNRRLAFRYICDKNQENTLQVAQNLLLDKSAVVRRDARNYMNRVFPDFNYQEFYRDHLEDCTFSAISGLGEIGKIEEADLLKRYLSASQSSIVRAAMTSVMRLDNEKYAPIITEFLADDRAGIVKTARNLIIKIVSPNYERVMEIYHSSPYENTKKKCFSILLNAAKWQKLIFILGVLETRSEDITESAKVALRQWVERFNRSYATASKVQIEEISEKVGRLNGKIPSELHRRLVFFLR